MTISSLTSGLTGTSATATGTSNASSGSNASSSAYSLSPSDFISLMVTQLQNQDPLSPTDSSALLTQVSQIGQLQSSTDLQTTLNKVNLQSQVGSASALIGKTVSGISTANKSVTGVVDSVSVSGSDVNLNLDSGDTVSVSDLSSIAGSTTGASNASSGSPVAG